MKKLKLSDMYAQYLDAIHLSESEMGINQRIETRRAFMGGCGKLLSYFQDVVEDMDEDEGARHMSALLYEAMEFWAREVSRDLNDFLK